MELEPEQLELRRIIGLDQQVIQEVLESATQQQFYRYGLAIEKLLMIGAQFLKIGNYQMLLD